MIRMCIWMFHELQPQENVTCGYQHQHQWLAEPEAHDCLRLRITSLVHPQQHCLGLTRLAAPYEVCFKEIWTKKSGYFIYTPQSRLTAIKLYWDLHSAVWVVLCCVKLNRKEPEVVLTWRWILNLPIRVLCSCNQLPKREVQEVNAAIISSLATLTWSVATSLFIVHSVRQQHGSFWVIRFLEQVQATCVAG